MEGSTVTVGLGAGGYRAVAEARTHRVPLDEPESLGGSDTGPTPVEMLLGALGACTAMTLRMYSDRKGWDVREVRVELTHQQLSRAECLDCPPDEAFPKVDRIHRTVEVDGELSDEQLARLLDIANRCPVHRILSNHPTTVTEIRRGPPAPAP
jgi:putative redox protein